MTERYRVRLDKEYHVFCAGHFITFGGNICERLHGHNYRVQVEVEGPLDENQYVIDFIALRDALKAITNDLDHRMMLPTEHRAPRVQADDREVVVTFEDRRWVFPRCDCVLLPMPNTTAELLARYIGRRLLEALQTQPNFRPERLQVAVDEDNGHGGSGRMEGRLTKDPRMTNDELGCPRLPSRYRSRQSTSKGDPRWRPSSRLPALWFVAIAHRFALSAADPVETRSYEACDTLAAPRRSGCRCRLLSAAASSWTPAHSPYVQFRPRTGVRRPGAIPFAPVQR